MTFLLCQQICIIYIKHMDNLLQVHRPKQISNVPMWHSFFVTYCDTVLKTRKFHRIMALMVLMSVKKVLIMSLMVMKSMTMKSMTMMSMTMMSMTMMSMTMMSMMMMSMMSMIKKIVKLMVSMIAMTMTII